MNTLEIAQKYGVPTPETCRGLDWKGETVFYWHIIEGFKPQLMDYGVYTTLKDMVEQSENEMFIPAPQMHEIAPLLPLIVEKDKDTYFLDIQTLANGKQYLQYSDDEGFQQEEYCEFFCIQNHHYAEAYAQLYLKLKNEGLL